MKLPDFFEADHAAIESAAARSFCLPKHTPPSSIHRAMRYSVFAGGKRIRPILCLESARMFTASSRARFRPAARSNSFTPIR
jgi:geranylgeranyl pyrophosphate synthase